MLKTQIDEVDKKIPVLHGYFFMAFASAQYSAY